MSRSLKVDDAAYSNHQPMIIAEIGTGHNGDVRRGEELVAAAIEAGAGWIKFQHVQADEILHPATGLVPLPGGNISLYERFQAVGTSADFLGRMKEATECRGAHFLCTPFGRRSAGELLALGVTAMKVASPELNHLELLDVLADSGLPIILSTGVSRLGDIETALGRFARYPSERLALLHCVTAYPAPPEDYNLEVLAALSRIFGILVGVSDHSSDPLLVPTLSIAAGAGIVEKHICLSRTDAGLDDPIALPPSDFAAMVKTIKEAVRVGPAATMAAMAERYGQATVAAVMGDGVKRLAPSEALNYTRTNRSIHARMAISRGQRFGLHNLAVLRTEKVLQPGLQPALLSVLDGRLAARDIADGEGIQWADVGGFSH
jgi:N-acetylneuraminate synthase